MAVPEACWIYIYVSSIWGIILGALISIITLMVTLFFLIFIIKKRIRKIK